MVRLRREHHGRGYRTVAVSANGYRETVLSRNGERTLDEAEEHLLRALARKLGFNLVRRAEWEYQLEVAAKAHKALTLLRDTARCIDCPVETDTTPARLTRTR